MLYFWQDESCKQKQSESSETRPARGRHQDELFADDESQSQPTNACGATAAQKRARKEDGVARKEEHIKDNMGDLEIEPDAKLIMHDDSTAMIQVCRSAKNGQMGSIGRTLGVPIRPLHEAT